MTGFYMYTYILRNANETHGWQGEERDSEEGATRRDHLALPRGGDGVAIAHGAKGYLEKKNTRFKCVEMGLFCCRTLARNVEFARDNHCGRHMDGGKKVGRFRSVLRLALCWERFVLVEVFHVLL